MSAPAPQAAEREDDRFMTPVADAGEAGARSTSPYSPGEKVKRLLWAMVQGTLFRASFHNWYALRSAMLRAFGARLERDVRIRRTVRIECPWNLSMGENSSIGDRAVIYCLGPVSIGRNVSISQHAHVCAGTHDFTVPNLPLIRPAITIADEVWIAADAFVGPGIRVGEGAILGARSCAFKDMDPWTIYGGNPAKAIRERPRFDNE